MRACNPILATIIATVCVSDRSAAMPTPARSAADWSPRICGASTW